MAFGLTFRFFDTHQDCQSAWAMNRDSDSDDDDDDNVPPTGQPPASSNGSGEAKDMQDVQDEGNQENESDGYTYTDQDSSDEGDFEVSDDD